MQETTTQAPKAPEDGQGAVSTRLRFVFICLAVLCWRGAVLDAVGAAPRAQIFIDIDTAKPVASFLPGEAFGAGLDGLEEEELEEVYTPDNLRNMAQAPYRRLAYRLRTELGIEAWHWNAAGTWSEGAKQQGYWTSSETAAAPLLTAFGYRLPRRGSTLDQAGNDGYSRLDDGDPATFWKSNPYLDRHFTGIDNAAHPQWVLIDLGKPRPVDTLRILWGEPFAGRYQVQYWNGKDEAYLNDLTQGVWQTFAYGDIRTGRGGEEVLRLCDQPVAARFVRILLLAGSTTAAEGPDIRDRLGFAIRELFLGGTRQGKFQDHIRHGRSRTTQTEMTVSSTDPWHRAVDLNPKTAQPGFDRILASGLGKDTDILMPVAILYNTPEDAAAQIRFLKARNFPLRMIELGEEPDGQNTTPEHYAALYLQFVDVVHAVDPTLITGGPGFQSEVEGWNTFPDSNGESSWMKRFLNALRHRNRLHDFGFFSFEWYPFDDLCRPPSAQLRQQPALMKTAWERLEREGVPRNIPWILSEYGYSSFAGRAEVELPAALLNAEIVAQFLSLGGTTAYLYGLEPNSPIRELEGCADSSRLWGNLMLYQKRPGAREPWKLPAYYGGKMLLEEWAEQTDAPHRLFSARVVANKTPEGGVTAYAVLRPDSRWAILILNKTERRVNVHDIRFTSPGTTVREWQGPIDGIGYSPRHYAWQAADGAGRPTRNIPPRRFLITDLRRTGLVLQPLSLTVLRDHAPKTHPLSR